MGEEIQYSRFNKTDYLRFEKNLHEETDLLKQWFGSNTFSKKELVAGYELEAWLLDNTMQPYPENDAFLKQAKNDLLTLELARFNVELNVLPESFNPKLLQHFDHQLSTLWRHCQQSAHVLSGNILGIGILPTLQDKHLSLDNISSLDRYRALNEQVLRQRHGQKIKLSISGSEHLQVEHQDVMLEAAATSLQIHLQVPQDLAVRYYNASIALSAAMVAISENSPFLFGKQLWQETRIPVFEQAVAIGGLDGAVNGPIHRVSFGSDYAHNSLFECFQENIEHYPVLLPVEYHTPLEEVRHLRLHNGTIWRWNRPLIGFDEDGCPHLRIEHRVMAAAPSNIDNIANMAFYYGLVEYYANHETPLESLIDFSEAKDNFYLSAQHGLKQRIMWTDKKHHALNELVLDTLLTQAETGLSMLGINETQSKKYLGIIEKRVASGQTGSQWQRQFAEKHHKNMSLLTQTYFNNQQSACPIHEWDFSITPEQTSKPASKQTSC